MTGDRAIRWSTVAAVTIVAGIAGWASYEQGARALAGRAGGRQNRKWSNPRVNGQYGHSRGKAGKSGWEVVVQKSGNTD